MPLIELLDFNVIGDERGNLVSLEQMKNVPFEIKRVYYIFGSDTKVERGFHAHKKLRQIAICLNGSCEVLMNDGQNQEVVTLDKPQQGLCIEPMQWHVMRKFSKDCVFLVIANDTYDEDDYIRDYNDFLKGPTL